MNILIINAHTANRGDEAAIKAMVDEIITEIPDVNITISINGDTFYPNMPKQVKQIGRMPKLHSKAKLIEFYLFYLSKTYFAFSKECKEFKNELLKADLVLHAPGGPSIGDIYSNVEKIYLYRLNLTRKLEIPYMFYAPSMGPFKNGKNDRLRRKVIQGAKKIIVRDPISKNFLLEYLPNLKVEQHLDSALQHDIDENRYENIYNNYSGLKKFMQNHKKCLGITITDLSWHPKYSNSELQEIIPVVFNEFIDNRISEGYGIIFIPQLYGSNDDTRLMTQYMRTNDTFIIDANSAEYDAYFQQYVIKKLYGVIGMRYHSNIFSAKMGTPFVSVSYEQKMQGFMNKLNLSEYCIPVKDLTINQLESVFDKMCINYDLYKQELAKKHLVMKEDSRMTTDEVIALLENSAC